MNKDLTDRISAAFLAGDATAFYAALQQLADRADAVATVRTDLVDAQREVVEVKEQLADAQEQIRQLQRRCEEHRAWEQNHRELIDDVRNDDQGKRLPPGLRKRLDDLIPVGFKRTNA